MGHIAKQSVKGSIYTYLGAALGFVNTVLLMPKLFSTEQVGLVSLLIAISIIFAQLGSMGFPNVLSRVFPHFRDDKNNHNGMLSLGFLASTAGFIVSFSLFLLSRNYIIAENIEKSALLVNNLFYLPIIIFFSIYFIFLDNYTKALFDAVSGTFLREIAGRVFILIAIGLFYFNIIDFEGFVALYVLAYVLPTFLISFLLILRKQFKLTRINRALLLKHKKEIIRVALFGIISGFSGTAVMNIDKYMITHYLGLSSAGIYSISFYFGALILMPARAMRKIGSIVIAEAWAKNDMKSIEHIYSKSTITQLIIGLFLFLGIWTNIDSIFKMIPDYADGKYVIFFVGLGYVLEMAGGLSGMILLNSKYYTVFSYLALFNVAFIVISNIIFIPIWQLTGGAFASFLTIILFVLIRFIFLWKKFKLNPYSHKHLIIIAFAIISFVAVYFIPEIENVFLSIFVKGSILSIVFIGLLFITKISEDMNEQLLKILRKIILRK